MAAAAVVAPALNTRGPGYIDGHLEESAELQGEDAAVYLQLPRLVPAPLLDKAEHLSRVTAVRGYRKEKPRAETTASELQRILEWRKSHKMDEVRARQRRRAPPPGLVGVVSSPAQEPLRLWAGSSHPAPQSLLRLPDNAEGFHKGWPAVLAGEDCHGHAVFYERIEARVLPPSSRRHPCPTPLRPRSPRARRAVHRHGLPVQAHDEGADAGAPRAGLFPLPAPHAATSPRMALTPARAAPPDLRGAVVGKEVHLAPPRRGGVQAHLRG